MRTRRTGRPRRASAIVGALARRASCARLAAGGRRGAPAAASQRFLPERRPSLRRRRRSRSATRSCWARSTQLAARGFEVDVRGCRQMSEGLSRAAARGAAGSLPRRRGGGARHELDDHDRADPPRAAASSGRDRVLGLVTPREVGGVASSDQAVIRRPGGAGRGGSGCSTGSRYSAGTRLVLERRHAPPAARGARLSPALMAPRRSMPGSRRRSTSAAAAAARPGPGSAAGSARGAASG